MSDGAGVNRDPADRAQELLELSEASAKQLVEGLASFGLLAGEDAEPARLVAREQARHLFLFVILSVLLENRPAQDPSDRLTAESLKEAFLLQAVKARKAVKAASEKSLPRPEAQKLAQNLDAAARRDPLAPYYGSFEKMRRDPDQGPFGLLAGELSRAHFEGPRREDAYNRVFTLAAALADGLISRLDSEPRN
jgi:hypothetical protein